MNQAQIQARKQAYLHMQYIMKAASCPKERLKKV